MSKNQALNKIKSYLDKRAKEDELFANMYAKKDKNINGCFSYIIEVARKRGNEVCMTDEEVYGLAVHYYCEDDLKVNKLPSGTSVKVSTSNDVALSKRDKKRLKEEVEAEYKKKLMSEMKETRKASKKKTTVKEELMGSLFDF